MKPRFHYIKLLPSLVLLLILCVAFSCSEEKHYKIGVAQCSSDDWREKMNDEIRREIMLHDDAEVEIRSADDSSEKQIEDIRYFVDSGFDIIIVSPNEAKALTPVIREVYENGMPIVIFDRNINGDTYTAHIGVDDPGLGAAASRYARHLIGDHGKAIDIYGLPGSTPADGRHEGFTDDFTKNGGLILGSAPGNWNKENAEKVADSLLRAHPDTQLIFAHNDRMAIGGAEVARRLGRDDIRVIGIDAAPNIGIQAVADGVIDATFLYPTEGHRLIRTALDILKGNPYEKETLLPLSSAVDKTNADILLLQNETLVEETAKMKTLKGKFDDYLDRQASQRVLFYAMMVILALICGVFFLVLTYFWQHRRYQAELLERNRLLEEERDKQKELNSKLEEATQTKLMFFTNVSHDLRTPLTLIAEPVAQLAEAKNLTDQQHTLIKIADKNVRILHRLINQILDFRKYENGKLKLHLSEVDLRKIFPDWLESFHQLARKRDIKLRLCAPEGSATIPMALDVEKMERVFFNLVSNAFKYSRDNSSITVSYDIENEKMILKVADTGEGISERDLGNIFDRFYQVDRIHPKGSGIGLSLVKSFVELHGGDISVESELNKGTTFTIVLPITHVSESAEPVEKNIGAATVEAELEDITSDKNYDSDKPLLLIIDDNRDIRKMVEQLMSDEYNVIEASNGKEGLRRAAKYVPDLIICDVMMPGMNGLECCRRLKEETSTSHIPVLMLTACTMDEQRVQGYEHGADGYLSKPFSSAVLKARSASLIRNRRLIKDLWQVSIPTRVELPKEAIAVSEKNTGEKAGAGSVEDNIKGTPKGRKDMPRNMNIENEFYNRFLEIFEKELGNPDTTVDTLAGKMGLERTQFYRKIKAITNYSPVELMRNIRLKRARAMVTSTERSISEIGYEVGFSTPAYFTKCYREAFGETPSETRIRISGES